MILIIDIFLILYSKMKYFSENLFTHFKIEFDNESLPHYNVNIIVFEVHLDELSEIQTSWRYHTKCLSTTNIIFLIFLKTLLYFSIQ